MIVGRFILATTAVALAAGCSDHSPPPPRPEGAVSAAEGVRPVTLWPVDGMTNFKGSASILVSHLGSIEADVPALSSGLRLLTSPARKPVAITIVRESVPGAGGGTRFVVNPDVPLGAGTFVFRVEALPSGYTWTWGLQATRGADGAVEVAFSTVSAPRLAGVAACETSGLTKVRFLFSETLASASAGDFTIAYADAAGGAPDCAWPGAAGPSAEYAFQCSLDATRRTSLTVRAGLRASSGVTLGAEEHEVVLAALPTNADGCRVQNF